MKHSPIEKKLKILVWPSFDNIEGNPVNLLLYETMQSSGVSISQYKFPESIKNRFDIFHIHWPESIFNVSLPISAIYKALSVILFIIFLKLRGIKIVWTVHNIESHDKRHIKIEKIFWKVFIKFLDGFICLSNAGRNLVIQKYPELKKIPSKVILHGHYKNVYKNEISKKKSRKILGINDDDFLLLFFGSIRAYKNILHLIDVVLNIEDQKIKLIIAGKPESEILKDHIISKCKNSDKITTLLDYMPDDEIQIFFNASDLVTLPFTEILNSGSAILALSFDRPILVPKIGAMMDLKNYFEPGWVYLYDGEFTKEVLLNCLQNLNNDRAKIDMNNLSWEKISKETLKFYHQII